MQMSQALSSTGISAGRRRLWLLSGVAAASLLLASGAAEAKNSTAQSVQIAFSTEISSLLIEGSETWAYAGGNDDFDTYFTLGTVSGSPNSGQINAAKNQAFNDNQCNFWNGQSLVEVTKTAGPVTLKAVPKAPGVYDDHTRWTMTDSSPGDPIDLAAYDIFVAAESYLKNSQKKGGWTEKYSFGLGDTSSSRLSSLTIELLLDGQPVAGETRVLGTDFFQVVESGDSWDYEGNAGKFGTDPGALGKLVDGDVNTILGQDDFLPNDGTGGGRAFIDEQDYTLTDEGVYELRFSGVVKGNTVDGLASQSFNIDKAFVVLGVDCS